MKTPTLYTTAEAAALLEISTPSVRRLAVDLGAGTRRGRDWLFTAKDIATMRSRPRRGKYDRSARRAANAKHD